MKKLFYFPSEPISGYQNPYSNHFKSTLSDKYQLLDNNRDSDCKRMFTLLTNSFRADVFVLNWLESVSFWRFGTLLFIIACLALLVIKMRSKKILWMFHNIRAHQGRNWQSQFIQSWLFNNAELIITHSQEAEEYAKGKSKCKVVYKCHPIQATVNSISKVKVNPCDVFIWGTIEPYKGVLEFISLSEIQNSNLRIHILGRCKSESLTTDIHLKCNNLITFENKRAKFEEIAMYCQNSKVVLFPYIGECVSSSGALIDTIAFGGNPLGPSRGAFVDLSMVGVCKIYNTYSEMLELIRENSNSISEERRRTFIEENSWKSFVDYISHSL